MKGNDKKGTMNMVRLGVSVGAACVFGVLAAQAIEVDLNEVTGVAQWGGRKPHLAVVNPVVGQDPVNVLSLCGEWDFTTFVREGRSEVPLRNGIWGKFYSREWKHARKINVPGCWEAQGVGEPGKSICWDPFWDENSKDIRHLFMGAGWYRRTVTIPVGWKDKRVWIKLGGVKSVGYVWVNERQVALVDTYCGTEKYEITDLVEPGKPATIVIQADNRCPSRKGLMSAMHRWGGVYRAVELEATPKTFIDDAWVRGNFDEKAAEVNVEVNCSDCSDCSDCSIVGNRGWRVRAQIDGASVEQAIEQSGNPNNRTILKVPLRDFRPWSPEHPNLYTAKVELVANGSVVQTRWERFGVRKLEVRGKDFYLNDKPFFFRGFGDDHVYPLTGMTPADVNEHRKHLAIAHRAGFNFVRLHTHCEVPEYFEAADEQGIFIQAELPYYSDVPAEGFSFDPKRDVTDLWRNYRRHPSFAVYSMGNEGSYGPDLDKALHAYVKAMDPDRLKINQDCHVAEINPLESSDYLGGPISIWERGKVNPERPFVTHEYMNLGVKLDARTENEFTGVWEVPNSLAKRHAWLAGFGLDGAWGNRLQNAQHALQKVWQKRGIECARTDPYCDGFIYWTIVDVVVWNKNVQTFSGQGLFTPFWKQKEGGNSADDIAVFNRAAGLFADFPEDRRVWVAGETLKSDLRFANYGDAAVRNASVAWTLSAKGQKLGAGTLPVGDLALGAVRKIATASVTLPDVASPVKAELRFEIVGTPTFNTYPIWLFPKRTVRPEPKVAVADEYVAAFKGRYGDLLPAARAAEAEIVIAPYGSALAKAATARGQKTIQLDGCGGKTNVKLGWWWMGSQVGTAFLDHPVFGKLPHAGVLDELFFRIVKEGRQLPVDGVATKEMYAVGEGGKACYLYLGEKPSEKALLAFGLDVLADTPEGTVLLDGMIDYMKGK